MTKQSKGHTLVVELTQEEWAKLQQLAEARSKDKKRRISPQDCVRDLIQSCVPGGTGYVPAGR